MLLFDGFQYSIVTTDVCVFFPRASEAVKHFKIGWDGYKYKFGMGTFSTLNEFVEHFENKPLIGGDSGERKDFITKLFLQNNVTQHHVFFKS